MLRSKPHHSDTSTTNTTSRLLKVMPENIKPLINPKVEINTDSVEINHSSKLYGSFGETIVVFHRETNNLGDYIRFIQTELTKLFRTITPSMLHQEFITTDGYRGRATDFAPIENPHTTIIAMRVIDAKSKATWDKRLVQSFLIAKAKHYQHTTHDSVANELQILLSHYDLATLISKIGDARIRQWLQLDNTVNLAEYILSHSHDSLHESACEQAVTEQVMQHPSIMLEIDCIALSTNGSLGIRWKENDDLIKLRETFSELGGVAKHGNEVINTTIGYFPYCNRPYAAEILEKLKKIEPILNAKLPENRQFRLTLTEAEFVKFSRNDLHPDRIVESRLLIDNKLNTDFEKEVEFPVELQQVVTKPRT